MNNPWNEIDIDTYEKHMSLNNVYQLQTMNKMMQDQFYIFPAKSIMILGIAGGNGLGHIDPAKINTVYGIDINENYLNTCRMRYPALKGVLHTLCVDLMHDIGTLPHADLIVADILIEYIGYKNFINVIKKVEPLYVSCVIQVNTDECFVSDSPFIHEFDRLDEVLSKTEETELVKTMHSINYIKEHRYESELPNGKKLLRIDFICQKT